VAKTLKTAIVIVPPRAVWPPIQAVRQQHDRHFRRWMPHVTLIYPFRPREAFAELAGPLAQACRDIVPFEIELAEFKFFRHRSSYTLWLAPEPRAALDALQAALWHVVPDCDETRQHGAGFTPHLSVGQVQGRDALQALLSDLQDAWTRVQFQVSEASLIWRNDPPDDVFRVGRTIPLGH
jgi:2'-5' RNA ligase